MNIPIQFNDDLNHIEGHLDDNARWTRKDLPPGTACWANGLNDQIACLRYVCPCGCGDVHTIPIKPGYGGTHWAWDGNTEQPTLNPSIRHTSDCQWHGYLTHGVFTSC